MNAVEKLQAAIDKLEQSRDERGYVEVNGWLAEAVDDHTCGTGKDGYYGLHEPGCGLSPVTNDELIVTLHRTIDVQLAILRSGRAIFYSDFQTPTSPQLRNAATALADAILGDA